jgi:hypothetical protein
LSQASKSNNNLGQLTFGQHHGVTKSQQKQANSAFQTSSARTQPSLKMMEKEVHLEKICEQTSEDEGNYM